MQEMVQDAALCNSRQVSTVLGRSSSPDLGAKHPCCHVISLQLEMGGKKAPGLQGVRKESVLGKCHWGLMEKRSPELWKSRIMSKKKMLDKFT